MDNSEETKEALLVLLKELTADPTVPVSLYDIGVPLVAKGYKEGTIVDVLLNLESGKVIELIDGNRLILRKPLG